MSGPASHSLYYGDCLDWMSQWDDQTVDLIYLDPPFNSNQDYNVLYSDKGVGDAQFRAFNDTWSWDAAASDRLEEILGAVGRRSHQAIRGLNEILGKSGALAYLTYMAERLDVIHRILKPSGSVYLHCDPTMSHSLKLLMDCIFGPTNFRSEIIWRRTGSHNKLSQQYGPIHDVILFYSGGDEFTFSPCHTPYTREYIKKQFTKSDSRGIYRFNELTGSGSRKGASGTPWRGYDPTPKDRHWAIPRSLRGALPEEQQSLGTHALLDIFNVTGDLVVSDNTFPRYKQRKGQGVLYQDIWAYQPGTKGVLDGSKDGVDRDVKWLDSESENLGYPTQKPLGLLERIIKTSSKRGDLVLDPFCGCGTTVEAAQNLGRQWAGVDISSFAIDLILAHRLKMVHVTTCGIPYDYRSAKKLAKESPFNFEAWAVTRLPGFAPNIKQRADGGVDGRATLYRKPDNWRSRLALAQVKGGKFKLGELRDFIPDYSWDMLIRASNPAFSCGRSPVSLEPLSIRLNRLTNGEIEPIINHFPARGTVTRRQVDFPARNPHRFGPFHGPDSSSVHYPGAQDTRASLCHNRLQSVAP